MPERGEGHDETQSQPVFKAKVALTAPKGEQALVELTLICDVHAHKMKQRKGRLTEGMAGVYEDGLKVKEPKIDIETLHAKIGQLTLEDNFCPEGSAWPIY